MAPYYLILGAAMLLLVLGLVMVLSSSGVESYEIYDSAFTLFSRQAMFAVIGVVAMLVISRLPIPVFRRFALAFLVLSIVMLLLTFVPGIGAPVNGQRNWIRLVGPFRLQPSEFAKLGADPVVRGPLRPPGGLPPPVAGAAGAVHAGGGGGRGAGRPRG